MEVGSSSLPGTTHRRRQCVYRPRGSGTTSDSDGGLAQLARAPALQAGGQRFESVILHDSVCDWGRGMGNHHFSFLIPHFSFRKEIFDILTHKTVSKDFKLKTELYFV